MRARTGTAIAIATGAATVAVVLALSGESSSTPATRPAAEGTELGTRGAREDCSTRSEASFPGAFTSPDNLVVGPLVLVGGAYTDARTVREFGGNKFPLLVKAGHTVTVRLAGHERSAGLAYGPLPQGQTRLRDTYQSVTFVACRTRLRVTFWSGFVLTRAPACIPLDVYVDGATAPRRVGLALGRRCRQ